jgi:hypothetical protein
VGAGSIWRRAAGKRGAFLHERLAAHGGKGVSVRALGGGRAGEMRIARFLHNDKVTTQAMMETARQQTCARVAGRHVLAIQDSSALRVDEKGIGVLLHPVLAVDADTEAVLGLIDNAFLTRRGGARGNRKQRPFADKDSRRWLAGAEAASALAAAGAACVTVVEDREGDIYECFAFKPAGVEKLVRAAQDRNVKGGSSVFAKAEEWAQAGRMAVQLPAAPGRKARRAELSLRFGEVEIQRPASRKAGQGLPDSIVVTLVVACETAAPQGQEPARWLLYTTHKVNTLDDARRIVSLYRRRWTIEQLFRTMKTKGFDIEALRQQPNGPLEKLVTAILIAAVTVMQLVAERDGRTGCPLADALDADDRPALAAICTSLEGNTAKQKNPHPPGTLAWAAWIFARLGGWTGYYGKPGPIVMLRGMTQFQTIKHGWNLRNV